MWVVYRSNREPVMMLKDAANRENARPGASLRLNPKIHKLITRKNKLRIVGTTKKEF